MAIKIDFTRDIAARCVERLVEAGYTPSPADDDDAIYTYVSIRHRRVRPQPRTVHKAVYSVPPDLVHGEQQLLAKVEAGEDLWPHQSRKIIKLSKEDGMLNDYGVQHFHLGTTPDPKHAGLISGTKDLLFAIVKDNEFYAIGIYDHEGWNKQAVLDLVDSTWPELTEPYTIKGGPNMQILGLSRTYTDDEAKKMRAAGINVLQQRPDGKIQMGLGGGIASDGSSFEVRRETDKLILHAQRLQAQTVETLNDLVADGSITSNASVRLAWNGDNVSAVVDGREGINADLSDRLMIPPL